MYQSSQTKNLILLLAVYIVFMITAYTAIYNYHNTTKHNLHYAELQDTKRLMIEAKRICGEQVIDELINYHIIENAEISYYTNSPAETNADNCHTADMTWICPATENIIANNNLPFDTIVEVDGVEYRVADRMNKRYGEKNFDILVNNRQLAFKLGRQNKTVIIK